MDLSKCAARCGQLLIIMVGFIFFFGGVPVLLLSLEEHSKPYMIIIGSLIIIIGIILITLGASGCCQLYKRDEESGLPYGHLEEEIKTEALTPGIYTPYRPYTNQGKFENWVDVQISQCEKNMIVGNSHRNSNNSFEKDDESVIDLGDSSSISKYDLIYNQPLPI